MIKLDLRYNRLNPEFSQLFNEIAINSRAQFTRLIDEMSEKYSNNLDWWVEGPSSRHNLASPLYHYFCGLHLLDLLLKNEYLISEIITDSFAYNKIIKEYLNKNDFKIRLKNNNNVLISFVKKSLMFIFSFFRELYKSLYHFWCAHKTINLKAPLPDMPLILIDIFSFPGYIDKDRYYNNLWDIIDENQKKRTFFVPTITMVKLKDLLFSYKSLRIASRNYLIKQDYLKIKDIIYALTHIFRVFKLKIDPISILGIDITRLVEEELRSTSGYHNAVEALLNYRFAKRLREKNIKLHLVINWFENQVMDKGWNAGFNKFYPKIISKGYRGSAPPLLYICSSSPSELERSSGVLPSIICVIGDGYIKPTKEFSRDLIVEKAPALRFDHLWNVGGMSFNKKKYNILIGLSFFIEESINILNLVIGAIKNTHLDNYSFKISLHPAVTQKKLLRSFNDNWPESFNIVGGINNLLNTTDLLISGGLSGICLESVSLGIPTIVVENPFGFSCNSIPMDVPNKLWKLCRTSEDIRNSINYFKNITLEQKKENRKLGNKIRESYFEPISKDGIMNFLNLSTKEN